jgi:hypothetical protein
MRRHSVVTVSRYGATVHQQVYVYGSIAHSSWGVGGWLLSNFLRQMSPETAKRPKHWVAKEIKTTFASPYTKVVSLSGTLKPDEIAGYPRKAGHSVTSGLQTFEAGAARDGLSDTLSHDGHLPIVPP